MFNRDKVRLIRETIQAELDKLAKTLGVKIGMNPGSFTSENVHFRLEVAEIGEDGVANTAEVENFRRYAKAYGMEPDDLGKTFKSFTGETYAITGLSPRRSKYPVHATRSDGKKFKFAPKQVLHFLGRKEAPY
jgi:hypothetical protein